MAFNWADYFDLADQLAQAKNENPLLAASFRSAVSRAYYAAFNAAKVFLDEREGCAIPTDGSVHQYVIDVFRDHNSEKYKQMSEILRRLRNQRNKADYSNKLILLRRDVLGSVAEAKKALKTLKDLSSAASNN